MELKIKKLYPDAILPEYAHPTDSGMDLFAYLDEQEKELAPGERWLVPTGISIKLPKDTEAQVRPKSGLALKNGLTVLNTPGTVDEGYTGHVQVIVINLSNESYTIKHGQKIAQLVICPVLRPQLIEVDSLEETDRGANGFGSTGV